MLLLPRVRAQSALLIPIRMKSKATLLGVFALVLLLAVIGGFRMSESPKPQTPTSTPRAVPARVVVSAAKPAAGAHPAEAELNALGLTANGGIGVRAGYRNPSQGGAN